MKSRGFALLDLLLVLAFIVLIAVAGSWMMYAFLSPPKEAGRISGAVQDLNRAMIHNLEAQDPDPENHGVLCLPDASVVSVGILRSRDYLTGSQVQELSAYTVSLTYLARDHHVRANEIRITLPAGLDQQAIVKHLDPQPAQIVGRQIRWEFPYPVIEHYDDLTSMYLKDNCWTRIP
ncbi:hypothetical protein [Dongshaea marina]|uniref:hypothetical protein n=1 Tax=Dongshaea marina TaxID=2047966 RepID=UPI000D3E1006|nr:hypothetical protein [Dongshaea marina]